MSETSGQATEILLPSSTVALFSRDQETLVAARDIENDWRFARVKLHVEEGDVLTATEAYKEISSPELIIIQTEMIDDSLAGQLEDLAEHCDEGTSAIVIGPDNDVSLYRNLIDMGVSDYIVKPVDTQIMADIIAKTMIEKIGVTGSRLIAFLGAKGGVGTSSLVQAAAWGISDIMEQKTIIIDVGGGWSTLGVGMGFEPSTTLREAVLAAENNDEDNLKRMLFDASDKLCVLASGGDVMLESSVTSDQIECLIDMLMVKYPVVIADLSHAPPELEKAVVTRANQVIVVSTPTLPSLRLSRSLIQEVKDIRGGNDDGIEMVVNMQGLAEVSEVEKSDIEIAMDREVSTIIPFAASVFIDAENKGKKLIDDKEGEKIVKTALLPIVSKVIDGEVLKSGEDSDDEESGILGGFLNKFKAK